MFTFMFLILILRFSWEVLRYRFYWLKTEEVTMQLHILELSEKTCDVYDQFNHSAFLWYLKQPTV